MNKPKEEPQVIAYNYHQCAKWVEHKLGIKNLRDVDEKYIGAQNKKADYRDFWHIVIDYLGYIHNGSLIFIPEDIKEYPEWAQPIIKCFHEEFGRDAEYWVEW